MKKSLIALAVAGALTAPMIAQADATLYGQLEARVISQDNQDLSVEDGTSVLGVKGTVDTGMEGVKAVFKAEWDIDNSVGDGNSAGGILARKVYAGLIGGFGELYIGKQNNPAYAVSGADDIFTRDSGAYQFSSLRVNNTIGYVLPKMAGLQLTVAAVADSGDANTQASTTNLADDGNDVDALVVSAMYDVAGLGLGVAYQDFSGADLVGGGQAADSSVLSFKADYTMDALYVVAAYEQAEEDGSTEEPTRFGLAAQYTVDNSTFGIGYADFDADEANDDNDESQVIISLQQKLGAKVSAYIEYASYDLNGANDTTANEKDALTLGYKVKF